MTLPVTVSRGHPRCHHDVAHDRRQHGHGQGACGLLLGRGKLRARRGVKTSKATVTLLLVCPFRFPRSLPRTQEACEKTWRSAEGDPTCEHRWRRRLGRRTHGDDRPGRADHLGCAELAGMHSNPAAIRPIWAWSSPPARREEGGATRNATCNACVTQRMSQKLGINLAGIRRILELERRV